MSHRKKLAEAMEADAQAKRLDRYKRLLGSDSLAKAADMDSTIEGASMPSLPKSVGLDASDVVADADKWTANNKAALAAFEEDEEDAKWAAKQGK